MSDVLEIHNSGTLCTHTQPGQQPVTLSLGSVLRVEVPPDLLDTIAQTAAEVQALADRVDQGAVVFSAGEIQFSGYVGVHVIPATDLVDGAVWRLSGAGLVSALTEDRALNPQVKLIRIDGEFYSQATGVADTASMLDRVVSWQGFLCVQVDKIKLSVQVTINDQAQALYAECDLFTDSDAEINVIAVGGFNVSETTQIASVLEKLK